MPLLYSWTPPQATMGAASGAPTCGRAGGPWRGAGGAIEWRRGSEEGSSDVAGERPALPGARRLAARLHAGRRLVPDGHLQRDGLPAGAAVPDVDAGGAGGGRGAHRGVRGEHGVLPQDGLRLAVRPAAGAEAAGGAGVRPLGGGEAAAG